MAGTICSLTAFALMAAPANGEGGLGILQRSIIEYNVAQLEQSLSEGAYRGQEGILGVSPETGRSLGLKVYIDKDYKEAKRLLEEAEEFFGKAIEAMAAKGGKGPSEQYVEKVCELAASYKNALTLAKDHLSAYRARLRPEADERFDKAICSRILERLLEGSLTRASGNLRDALADLYNQCRDLPRGGAPLNHVNVAFVNYVFDRFAKKAPLEVRARFDLDRISPSADPDSDHLWKRVLDRSGYRYVRYLEAVFAEGEGGPHPMPALLFLALIKQESNFNPRDISPVGAAGLTQIMPKTAIDLGMKHIFMPSYLDRAKSLMGQERSLRRKAISLIRAFRDGDETGLAVARRARRLMQRSLDCRKLRTALFDRYRKELLRKGFDDRLDPGKAIMYGYKYFSRMLAIQKGDISLALASYNAGPHRVRQYGGIPPFPETVSFRNRVLRYYREYLRRVNRSRSSGLAAVM